MSTTPASAERIAQALGQHSVVPNGYKCKCPAHEDAKASLAINTRGNKDGRPTVHCYAGCSPKEIYNAIESRTGMHFEKREVQSKADSKKEPIVLPAPVPWKPILLRGLAPSSHWEYTDKEGRLLFVVARYDRDDGKQILPYSVVDRNGNYVWKAIRPNIALPLYNLTSVLERPDAPILIVEGEKCVDVGSEIEKFAEFVIVTNQGGVNNWKKTDWSPLKGREVYLWPDNDRAGKEGFLDLAKSLNLDEFCDNVKIARLPAGLPEKWDIADPLPEGVAYADFAWVNAPKGGHDFIMKNVTNANYMQAFDAMYWLLYDGKNLFTVDKALWMFNNGIPYDIDKVNMINQNHPAWSAVPPYRGTPAGVKDWADDKLRSKTYCSGFRFRPGVHEPIIEEEGEKFVNTFTGWAFKPNSKGNCDIIKNHILHIVCGSDEKSYEYIWNYLSHIIQAPQDKPSTALVLRGKQGTGKSVVFTILQALLGGTRGYSVKLESIDQMTGRFNAFMASKLVVWVEEIAVTKSTTKLNKLKTLVTDATINIERKGKESYNDNNYARMMGSTNNYHAWIVEEGERRLSLVDVSDKRMQDIGYFSPLFKAIKDPEVMGRLMYELSEYKIKELLVRTPLENAAKNSQKIATGTPVLDLGMRILRDGEIFLRVLDDRREVVSSFYHSEAEWSESYGYLPSQLTSHVLHDIGSSGKYQDDVFSARDKRIAVTELARSLGCEEKPNTHGKLRLSYTSGNTFHRGSNKTDNLYILPKLSEARKAFCKYHGVSYEEVFDEIDNVVSMPVKKANTEIPF